MERSYVRESERCKVKYLIPAQFLALDGIFNGVHNREPSSLLIIWLIYGNLENFVLLCDNLSAFVVQCHKF